MNKLFTFLDALDDRIMSHPLRAVLFAALLGAIFAVTMIGMG